MFHLGQRYCAYVDMLNSAFVLVDTLQLSEALLGLLAQPKTKQLPFPKRKCTNGERRVSKTEGGIDTKSPREKLTRLFQVHDGTPGWLKWERVADEGLGWFDSLCLSVLV